MTIRYRPLLLLIPALLAGCQAERAAFQFKPLASVAAPAKVTEPLTEELPQSPQSVVLAQKAASVKSHTHQARAARHLLQRLPTRPSFQTSPPAFSSNALPRQHSRGLLRQRANQAPAGVAEAGLGTMFLGILGIIALLVGLVGMIFAGFGFFGFLAGAGAIALLISILVPYLTGG